jgi:hypothetical protein
MEREGYETQPEKSYTVEVCEQNQRVSKQPIDDPFIRTTINLRGWRSAWRVLRGLELTVVVSGTPERTADVMRLNHARPNWTGEPHLKNTPGYDTSLLVVARPALPGH